MKIHNAHGKKTMSTQQQQQLHVAPQAQYVQAPQPQAQYVQAPQPQAQYVQAPQPQNSAAEAYIMSQLNNISNGVMAIDGRIDGLSTKVDGLSAKIDKTDGRIDGLSTKLDKTDATLSSVIEALPGDFEKWMVRGGATLGVAAFGVVVYDKLSAN